MSDRRIAIRLGLEGKATVSRDLEDFANTGDASARRLARGFIKADEDIVASMQRRAAIADKINAIMPKTPLQRTVEANAGSNVSYRRDTGQLDGQAKSARDSAAAFRELLAAEQQLEARTKALLSTIDPTIAAWDRYNATAREAAALHDAQRISLEQFLTIEAKAAAQLEAVTGKTKQASTATDQLVTAQKRIGEGGTGFLLLESSAERSAAAFRELFAAEDQLTARTKALLSTIDPTIAAQDRFNAEMGEARALVAAGTLTLDAYCDKLRVERSALDAATAARGRGNISIGQMRAGSQQLSYQIGDVAASFGSGTPIIQIFAQQIGQTVQAVQLMTGASKGFIGFIAGPWGSVLTGGIIILTTLAGKYLDAGDAAKKKEEAAKALTTAMETLHQSTQRQIESEYRAAEASQATAYSYYTQAQQAHELTKQNIALAKSRLAAADAARTDPALAGDGGVNFGVTVGATIAKQLAGLEALEKKNAEQVANNLDTLRNQDIAGASRRVRENIDGTAAATGRFERSLDSVRDQYRKGKITLSEYTAQEEKLTRAHDAEVEALRKKKDGTDRAAASQRRQVEAMEVNASAALDLARAYLVGGDAALRAEAARKGLTDATRKGIDTEAQVRRQLAIMVGDEVVGGAKSVARLREEATARATVRAEIQAGALTWDQANDALAEEAALRPLLKLQTVAQGDALKALTEVIDQYRIALRRARDEEMQDASTRAAAAAQDRAAELRSQIADLPLSDADRRRNADQRAAIADADRQKFTGQARKDFLRNKRSESEAGIDFDRARFVSDMLEGQKTGLAMATEELRLAAANDNVREQSLAKLRLILDLKRAGVDLDSADGVAILANADAYDVLVRKLREQQAAWAEMTDFGNAFVDTVLSPDTWKDWGEGGKTVIDMIRAELLKLALINPIKNLLYGESNVTLGSLLKGFGAAFGGSGAGASTAGSQGFVGPPGNATGTHYSSGGDTLVGEFGREIVRMPRGASVVPAGETRRMLAANDAGPAPVSNYFDLRGAMVNEQVYADMRAMAADAAAAGAMGGAQMAETDGMERSARRLGRGW